MKISLKNESNEMLSKFSNLIINIIFNNNFIGTNNLCEYEKNKFLNFIKLNKIQLAYLPNKTQKKLEKTFIKEVIISHKVKLEHTKKYFNKIYERFNNKGIGCLLIKSSGNFPYLNDNVDIIINPELTNSARTILEENNYFELVKWSEPFKAYYRLFETDKEILSIHLHEKVAWDGNIFLDYETCKDNCEKLINDPYYFMPSPENSFIITLAHAIYENKFILLGDYQKLIFLKNNFKLDENFMYNNVRKYNWEDGFALGRKIIIELEKKYDIKNGIDKLLNSYDKKRTFKIFNRTENRAYFPFKIKKTISRFYFIKKFFKDKEISLKQKILWLGGIFSLAIKRKLKITIQSPFKFRQTPYIISFSGKDNSGKTTLACITKNIFENCDIKNKYIWSRIGSSSFFIKIFTKPFSSFFKKKKLKSIGDNFSRERRFSFLRKNRVLKYMWLLIASLDYLIRINTKIAFNLMLGKVIILDRYYLDAVDEIGEIFKKNNSTYLLFKKLLKNLLIKSNITFFVYDKKLQHENNINYGSNLKFIKKNSGVKYNSIKCTNIIMNDFTKKWSNYQVIKGFLNL